MFEHTTVLDSDVVGDLGPVRLRHPPGTFALTSASLVSLEALSRQRQLLRGTGVDWGSGVGGLAIVAARIPGVDRVVGLEESAGDVLAATSNAKLNQVQDRVRFIRSDSFVPLDPEGGRVLHELEGGVDFLISNPPAAAWGDGFDLRRRILRESRPFMKPGAVALLQISSQYGERRILGLQTDAPGFHWRGVAASSGWVPFDLSRPDLLRCLRLYASEEERGGAAYPFTNEEGRRVGAREALDLHRDTGASPLSRWQVHRFDFAPRQSPEGDRRYSARDTGSH